MEKLFKKSATHMIDRCKFCKFKEGNHSSICPKYKKSKAGTFSCNKPNIGGSAILATILMRTTICIVVICLAVGGFYLSLLVTSDPLTAKKQKMVDDAIEILEQNGFTDEVFYLRNLASFRRNDNWLNASVAKENAYAATNYPFEIMTIYSDFFTYTKDDTERAVILLHEAKHLEGLDEEAAYEYVWKNKKRLGWTRANYKNSVVWKEIRKQTREYVPSLFVCDFNEFNDCTE